MSLNFVVLQKRASPKLDIEAFDIRTHVICGMRLQNFSQTTCLGLHPAFVSLGVFLQPF